MIICWTGQERQTVTEETGKGKVMEKMMKGRKDGRRGVAGRYCNGPAGMIRVLAVFTIITTVLLTAGRAGNTTGAKVATGEISGMVTEAATGTPVPYANIVVVGTNSGAMTLADGTYSIKGVPEGVWTVRVMMMGYRPEEKKDVRVKGGSQVTVDFSLEEQAVGSTQEILVSGEVNKLEIKDSDVKYGASKTSSFIAGYPEFRGGKRRHCKPYWPPSGYHNTEEYAHITENRFLGVTANPLSTFSIDVDAASYANVRRFIMGNSMPPEDAVRIEEMINYFDYDYARPRRREPFSINLEYSECPWNEDNMLVHIGLQGEEIDRDEQRRSNLVFLIDVSGSMRPANKLPLLKKAFTMLVEQLQPDDQVSIVVYAGAAGLVLPPTRGSRKETIRDAIDRLHSGGSTAGGEGIRLAYEVAAENFIRNGNNRVILATDGDFNVGISSTSELVRFIEKKRDGGIFLTVLGFGMGNYKDNRLEQLADKGNGNHAYIDNIMEAKKVLVDEVTATLYTIAKDVKIQVEFNPAEVESYRLIGYENRMLETEDFEDDRKDAGEIGAGHSVTALYEIVPASGGYADRESRLKYQEQKISNKGRRSGELLTVNIRYKEPDGEKSRLISKVLSARPVQISGTSDDFRFSAAVAMFGMILRNSEHAGDASLEKVARMACDSRGSDDFQYRAEFIQLVERARILSGLSRDTDGD